MTASEEGAPLHLITWNVNARTTKQPEQAAFVIGREVDVMALQEGTIRAGDRDIEVHNVHVPNGSDNEWAKVKALEVVFAP